MSDLLGEGAFSTVFLAYETSSDSAVAIKVPNTSQNTQTSNERSILSLLTHMDPSGEYTIKLLDAFDWEQRTCLVFELLHKNLYELIKDTGYNGVALEHVKAFAWQLAMSLYLTKTAGIVHGDIKPENIMLCRPDKAGVKLVDFGSASYSGDNQYELLQSLYYRAPEVVLGAAYGQEIDMWSLGCVLVELNVGRPLFPGNSEEELMGKIVKMRGVPSTDMLRGSSKTPRFFENSARGYTGKLKKKTVSIGKFIEKYSVWEKDSLFVELIEGLLEIDPKLRMTPEDVLNHPFVTGNNQRKSLSNSPVSKDSTVDSLYSSQPLRLNSCELAFDDPSFALHRVSSQECKLKKTNME